MSTEKRPRLPSTDEVAILASQQRGVEHLAGTILLERYRLLDLHGSGGASVVYRAEHSIMQKPVAVKILRPELTARQDFVQRFLAEARTVARLRHEHIVDIVDVGRTETGLVFCVMELLEGEELAATMDRDGPMPWRRAREIILQVCRALAAAHGEGIVHRDVKPQNCFRVRRAGNADFIKLLDFGIAKQTDNDQGLTATGVIMGTAEYMSPEQARGKAVDARADIYSVGAMLFEMLAGRAPFEGDSFLDVLMKHSSEPVPKLTALRPDLHPAIDGVIAKALAKRPDDRFATVDQLMAALVVADDHSFRGMLDQAPAEHRPESVLGGPSGPHRAVGWLAGVDRGILLALAVALVLIPAALFFAVRALREDASSATVVPTDAPTAELSPGEASPLPRDPTPPVLPSRAPESSIPAAEPPAPEPPVLELQPMEEPVTQPDPPTSTSADPSPTKKAVPTKQQRARLKERVMAKCGKNVHTTQTLTLRMSSAGTYAMRREPAYKLLANCVRDGVDVRGVPAGDYPMTLVSSKPTGGSGAVDPMQ